MGDFKYMQINQLVVILARSVLKSSRLTAPVKVYFFIFKEIVMRALMSVAALLSVAMPAFAAPVLNRVPEPESMALLAVAAVGMMIVRRIKK